MRAELPDIEMWQPCNLCPHMKADHSLHILDSLLYLREGSRRRSRHRGKGAAAFGRADDQSEELNPSSRAKRRRDPGTHNPRGGVEAKKKDNRQLAKNNCCLWFMGPRLRGGGRENGGATRAWATSSLGNTPARQKGKP